MNCARCGESMNRESFMNETGNGLPWAYDGWRCVFCGEIIDSLILINRRRAQVAGSQKNSARRGKYVASEIDL